MAYRYIGNKSRLAAGIVDRLAALVPARGVVADLMCGTASIAAELRRRDFRVVANDVMTYAAHHARVRLLLDVPPPFAAAGGSYYAALAALGAAPLREGLFFREYCPDGAPAAGESPRGYLSAANACRLDGMLAQLARWETDGRLTEIERSLLRHDLVLAVNRVANIAGTYGHFRSSWSSAALQPLTLHRTTFTPGRTDHVVHQGPVEDVAQGLRVDAAYIDPPYTKRQYAANYHLIETVARGDEPCAIGVSGLRPWRDQYSDFCSKVRLPQSLAAVLVGLDTPVVVMSYSEDGLLPRDRVEALLGSWGDVTTIEVPLPRFRSNVSPKPRMLCEYLFVLRRRRGNLSAADRRDTPAVVV